ncbi:MAG: amino acid adenylation domain-containing protein, partial [Sphaerospermopsis sp.]|nr:amino acid adenylation domain-containing protein [Sphaerospermopsis sp.]
MLLEFKKIQLDCSGEECIYKLFEKQVEKTPDAVALVFEEQVLTYRQLNDRANQIGHYLQLLGVAPDVLVGICVERSLEMFVGMLGILKAGGAYVPLDPNFPQERISSILSESQVKVVLTQNKLQPLLYQQGLQLVCLDEDLPKFTSNLTSNTQPNNLVYVIYTSGSTGKPKGVAIEHRQLFNYLNGVLDRLDLASPASFALISTFAADLGNTMIFPALCTGGCLHVISYERACNPNALADYFRRYQGIDCLKIVPTHLQTLLASCDNPGDIIPRKRLVLGGESSNWSLIEKLQTLAPECIILNHYGPTETTVGVLTYCIDNTQADCLISNTVPLGRPLPHVEILILDQNLKPVARGCEGELYIGGTSLARGYLNRPDLTQERFIPHPFKKQAGARLYKTGDLVRCLPNGSIEFLGRIDDQVKIRGFRIELGEIEAVISQHHAVYQNAVIVREDVPGDKRLVAYVVPKQGQSTGVDELRRYLKQKLPSYMIPSALVMLKDSLPITSNGKLDRQALPEPDTSRQEVSDNFVAPSNEVEQKLTEIWQEVLDIQLISIKDDFFDLGGNSLLAVTVFADIDKAFGVNLPMSTLFHATTIEALAKVIRPEIYLNDGSPMSNSSQVERSTNNQNVSRETSVSWSSLVPIQPKGDKPPLFCVHALYGDILCYYDLAFNLNSEQPVYGLQPKGLDGKDVPYTTVEEMASHYIKEMKTIQPKGPYYLAG